MNDEEEMKPRHRELQHDASPQRAVMNSLPIAVLPHDVPVYVGVKHSFFLQLENGDDPDSVFVPKCVRLVGRALPLANIRLALDRDWQGHNERTSPQGGQNSRSVPKCG